MIPTHPLERTLWVQQQLRLKNLNFSMIARAHGWNRATVAMAMRQPSFPQEQAISEALGVEMKELFPERYDAAGNRLHPILLRKDSRSPRGGECSKAPGR